LKNIISKHYFVSDKLKLKRNRETSEEREIREQNELRAKLGLAPLEKGVIPQNFA
jgi:hypothetical protein